ncbi:hypothetical protein SAMN05880574_12925 [Chryseobacterium sp. RU37D]|uniref:DUF1684 domain-containing protein n=1 Tax=Chryseobacterium sp. RU37D TaxID=1907397 RepID=UPI00095465E8|nr:DUF1684 domain-containing protein [Chryseobacterium sp. RU37D]SIQ86217.1 hypothetical protein SAMN05880574_12925 [Chryseobacterium sp. RU37D]
MKKYILIFLLSPLFIFSQNKNSKENLEIKRFQKKLNAEYLNPKETPLRGANFKYFKKHPFFPINSKYRLMAKLIKTENAVPFDLPTSSGNTKSYREYGKVAFEIDGKSYRLTLYQSLDLIKQEKYKDYLFLPFRDATNGKETYGGGKYMDLTIPKGNTIILDFNKSYQPYCAYNAYDYNCPIVPEENKLPIEIRAGVIYEDIYHH